MSVFSSLFGYKKAEETQITPHQAQRQKQLDSLKQQHKKLIEVVKDSSYRIPFSVGAQSFFLDISLTMMFPRDPPVLRLTPRGNHPWVDANGQINSPKMGAFSMHSDLGRLIGEIIEEFQRNPPLMPRDFPPSENVGSLYPNPNAAQYPAFPVPQPPVPRRSDSPGILPVHSHSRSNDHMFSSVLENFPDLKNMSNADLQKILDSKDEKVIWDKVSTTPVIASLRDEAARLMESNKKLAEENLARKPFLEQIKSDLFDKEKQTEKKAADALHQKQLTAEKKKRLIREYSLAGEKRQEFDDLQRQQESLGRQRDPSSLQDQLRIAASEAENDSDEVASQFVSGKIDLENFMPQFLEKRKLAHSRKAMEDCVARHQKTGGFY